MIEFGEAVISARVIILLIVIFNLFIIWSHKYSPIIDIITEKNLCQEAFNTKLVENI